MSILSISRIPQTRGYAALQVAVVDTSNQSPLYFDITHLPSRIGGGKSVIALRGNGTNLAFNSVIDVEIVDAAGKNVWCEFVNFVDRFNQYYISIEVHGSTAAGLADIYMVGRAKYDIDGAELVPEPGREFNLRWQGQIELAPNERNDSSLLFDKSPKVLVSQVYGPARLQTQATSSGYVFSVITSSANLLSIVDSNFKGYDRDFSSSPDILDVPTRNLLVHPTGGRVESAVSIETTNAPDNPITGGRCSTGGVQMNPLIVFQTSSHKSIAVPLVVACVVSLIRAVAVAAASPDRYGFTVPAPPPEPVVTVTGRYRSRSRALNTEVPVIWPRLTDCTARIFVAPA